MQTVFAHRLGAELPRSRETTATERHRAWTRLPSGGRLDLISPDRQAWTDQDLAIRLARTFRWGGESRWATPLSVAQHSLQVLEIARQSACGRLTPAQEAQFAHWLATARGPDSKDPNFVVQPRAAKEA